MDQNSANVTVSVAVILRGEEKVQDFFLYIGLLLFYSWDQIIISACIS